MIVTDETPLAKKRRARKIYRVLGETFPYAHAELDFSNPFELLVATVLSAQTTDIRVNSVTPTLFERYPDAHAMAQAQETDLQDLIRSTGFYKNKARALLGLSQALVEGHEGDVPNTLEDLVKLPGVGRKTAFVVLGNVFGVPGITTDTHVIRLANRFGWTDSTNANIVERDIAELFERKDYTELSHRVIFLGRRICHAKRPACGACPVAKWCPSAGIGENNPVAAKELLSYELAPGREHIHEALVAGASRADLRAAGYEWEA
ncbi:MAG: endonuclease III [Yaniella sp.]|uniref:endonuclease III n=2 Tax=Yaniella sp. TaxID=2773929 RepID=UPI002648B68D|nr:endonuclease III [Yaniella sp.]MDN5814418.1 endonuclease III [Yaniella sp.]MDN5817781.1 endonuclease III [Yaniella sp.]MDN5889602.1 endonuclease III [Yaniella sp.]